MARRQLVLSLIAAFALNAAAAAQPARLDGYGDPLPAGAIHRLGTLRMTPDGIPALSPDGKLLATSSDRGMQFWDAVTGKLVSLSSARPWGPLAFSPDGRWLASAPFGSAAGTHLHVYDAKSGEIKYKLNSSLGGQVAFSPDSKTLACGHWDGDVILYNLADGQVRHNLGACKRTRCIAFSPDGRYFAAGYSVDRPGDAAFVAVWECATGKRVCLLQRDNAGRSDQAVAFQPDNRHLLVSSLDLAVYDITTGKMVRVVQKNGVRSLAADRAGKRAISGSGEIWDLEKLEVVHRLQQPIYGSVAISADGSRAASSNPMRTWDVATGKALFAPPGHGTAYLHAAFSGDDERIVTLQNDQRDVLVWDAKSGKHLDAIPPASLKRSGPRSPLRSIDNGRIVFGWEVWDLAAKKRMPTLFDFVPKDSFDWPFAKIEISPDAKVAVDWNDHEGTRLWDVQTGRVLRKLCGPVLNQDPRSGYAFSPDSKTLAVTGGFVDDDPVQFRLIDVASGKTLRKFEPAPISPGKPRFSQDGRWLFLNRSRPGVEVWHVDSGRRFRELSGGWPPTSPFAVAPHGQLLVTTGGMVSSTANMNGVLALVVQDLHLLEVATGQLVCKLPGHTDSITVLDFAHDCRRFISGSRDNTALVWSLDLLASAALPDDDERLWTDLSADAAKAYPLLWALVQAPKRAVAMAEKRMQRDPAADPATMKQWVVDLGSASFARRSVGMKQLRGLGMMAWPAVKVALEKPTDLETRRRLEELAEAILVQPEPDLLRDLRVIQMLEMLGTPEARQTLLRVDKSSQHGPRAEAARSALARLSQRASLR